MNHRSLLVTSILATVLFTTGCVERRMTIRSVPGNALVLLDGREIGFTPVSVPFDYYGDRQIRLVKDGYESRTVNQTIAAPWYQWWGVDFVSEVLLPMRIRDERNYVYELTPSMMVPNEELLGRAEDVRARGQRPPEEVLRRAGLTQRSSSNRPTLPNPSTSAN